MGPDSGLASGLGPSVPGFSEAASTSAEGEGRFHVLGSRGVGSTAGEQRLGTHLQQGYVALSRLEPEGSFGAGVSVRGPAMLQAGV